MRKRMAFTALMVFILATLSACSLMTTQASLQSDQMYEDAKTTREQSFYNFQLSYVEAAKVIATTPLISVTTPDTVLPDGTIIKGTSFTVNREVRLPEIKQFNNTTPLERGIARGLDTFTNIAVATVPFIGAWAQSVEQRKSDESRFEYMTSFHQSQAAMLSTLQPETVPNVTTTTNNITETTNTHSEDYAYGDGSGNAIGGDSTIRHGSPDDMSQANPVNNSVNHSYNDQSSVEAPVVPIVPVTPIVPVITGGEEAAQ